MPAKVVVERKVRWVLALIVVMLVALPVLAVRNYIASVGGSQIHTNTMATDERLVAIDKRSMLVQPDALGPAMVHWLKSAKDKSFSFEMSDKSFAAGTAVPGPITVKRIDQVAQLMRASPSLMVHILLPGHPGSAASRQLDEQRAARLRDALTVAGANASHVTIEEDQQNLPTTRTARLAILLAK